MKMTVRKRGTAAIGVVVGVVLSLLCARAEDALGAFGGAEDTAAASNAATAESNARNVLDAHQTLMDIDEGNVQKFEKVVEFVKKDIDRMEQKKD